MKSKNKCFKCDDEVVNDGSISGSLLCGKCMQIARENDVQILREIQDDS